MRGMSQANMDLGIFQEKKVTDRIYTHGSDGYIVVATDALSRHCGRVAVFHRPAQHFTVEAVQQLGPNIVGFQLAKGERRWYIVECYLSPENNSMIESVVAALKERPRGAVLLVTGDFNANLSEPEGDRRGEDIVAAMSTEGLGDMLAHFLLSRRSWCREGRTWSMIREGREVRSLTDYILGTDRHIFGNVSVQDPRHKSDHYMVLGCLHIAPLREHVRYLRGSKRLPLLQPIAPTKKDGIFTALRRAVPKPLARDARRNTWISAATWRLVDKRVSARRYLAKDQELIRKLGRAIKESLQDGRQRREEEAGAEVEELMGSEPPLHRETWHRING